MKAVPRLMAPISMVLKPAVRVVTLWKKAGKEFVPEGERRQGLGVVPFQSQVGEGADQQQRAHHGEHQLGVNQQTVAPGVQQVRHHVELHQKPHAAQDDQQRDDQTDQWVAHKAHQIVTVEREACVVEGADRVEDRVEEPSSPALQRHETKGEERRACRLQHEGIQKRCCGSAAPRLQR